MKNLSFSAVFLGFFQILPLVYATSEHRTFTYEEMRPAIQTLATCKAFELASGGRVSDIVAPTSVLVDQLNKITGSNVVVIGNNRKPARDEPIMEKVYGEKCQVSQYEHNPMHVKYGEEVDHVVYPTTLDLLPTHKRNVRHIVADARTYKFGSKIGSAIFERLPGDDAQLKSIEKDCLGRALKNIIPQIESGGSVFIELIKSIGTILADVKQFFDQTLINNKPFVHYISFADINAFSRAYQFYTKGAPFPSDKNAQFFCYLMYENFPKGAIKAEEVCNLYSSDPVFHSIITDYCTLGNYQNMRRLLLENGCTNVHLRKFAEHPLGQIRKNVWLICATKK